VKVDNFLRWIMAVASALVGQQILLEITSGLASLIVTIVAVAIIIWAWAWYGRDETKKVERPSHVRSVQQKLRDSATRER
jgi:hypothetical protein